MYQRNLPYTSPVGLIIGYGDSLIDSSGARLMDGDGFLMEFCEYDNSDMEDYTLPDDFPEGKLLPD